MASSSWVEKTRERVQKESEQARRVAEHKEAKRRQEIISKACKAHKERRLGEAARGYQAFIRSMETIKGVRPGQLSPSVFDRRREAGDLVVLAGIYWDLSRIFDGGDRPELVAQLKISLEKFVLFSKGFPHQAACSESLRKYMKMGKHRHGREFRTAYEMLTGSKCFVVASLLDVTEDQTIDRLRAFRDEWLACTVIGRAMIRVYYAVGPVCANLMDFVPRPLRRWLGRSLDRLAERLSR